MFNLDDLIRDFARATFNYALHRHMPVYLSTKNTILKAYDGRFKDIFAEVFAAEFSLLGGRWLTYEHRLIDDTVAAALKWSGGYVWACKNSATATCSPTRWRKASARSGWRRAC